MIQLLLKYGASLAASITLHDLTPLHLAARHGHAEVVKILLENKASLIARDEDGLTPLLIAVKYNQASVLNLLLNTHADCNAIDNDENTALALACKNGSHVVVRMLLSKPECETGSNRIGKWPPLSIASDHGFYKCAQLLLERGADTEIQYSQGGTPLRHAALNGHLELCQLLLEYGAGPNTSFNGNPILSESIEPGKLEIVKTLIARGAKINALNSKDETPLHQASLKGDKALVVYLLDHGTHIDRVNSEGCNPTILVAVFGFAEIVQLLIDRDEDPQHSASDGWTALHMCWQHAEVTQTLLKNGVDVNKMTNRGLTPLHIAAWEGKFEVVKIILSYDPNLEITTPDGESALTIATFTGHTEVIRLLLEAGANINHRTKAKKFALQYAAEGNREDVLRLLMEYNPDLNLVDGFGNTALHCIRSDSSVRITKILVNGGAHLKIRNELQHTPICHAVWSDNSEILKYLAKKAELDMTGGSRGGPLHVACWRSQLLLVKILIDAGANPNLIDPVFGTPLQNACCCSVESSKEEQESVVFYLVKSTWTSISTAALLAVRSMQPADGQVLKSLD